MSCFRYAYNFNDISVNPHMSSITYYDIFMTSERRKLFMLITKKSFSYIFNTPLIFLMKCRIIDELSMIERPSGLLMHFVRSYLFLGA